MEVVGGRSLEEEEGGREGREVPVLLGSAAAVDVVALVEVAAVVQGQAALLCLLFRWSAGRQTGRSGLLEGGCRDVVLECRMAREAGGGGVGEGLVGDGQVWVEDGVGVVAGGDEERELDDGPEHGHWLGEDGVGGGV